MVRNPGGARSRLGAARWLSGAGLFLAIAVGGSTILVSQSESEAGSVAVDDQVAPALSKADPGAEVETFLLVGSDTRDGADPSDPDFGSIGDGATTDGRRSDTIMLLRHDRDLGVASLLSLPRDLWIDIAGTGDKARINSAYSKGTDVLVDTIEGVLGVPINHYVEVDFQGFKVLVDAVDGVPACFDYATRDKHTGLAVPDAGCYTLDGVQSLQYTRSRHFQEFRDGEWTEDIRSDLGRIARQQQFILAAVTKAQGRMSENPFALEELIKAAQAALVVDPDLDVFQLASRFSDLSSESIVAYQLPVSPKDINGNAVLLLQEDEARPILDFFTGRGPAPEPVTDSSVAADPGGATAGGATGSSPEG
jgi:polyisoprenyl-teichoic acid--peptidoglycan teichoic acid transferase